MIKSKALIDTGWKDLASKNKLKDNGLLKVLGDLKKVGDQDHDNATRLLDEVVKLATQLRKDKGVAAVPAAAKYVAEVLSAAEAQVRDVAKARAEAEKAKAKADAKAEAARKDEDDDEAETPELLTSKMLPLLRLANKGEAMHALVASAGKQVAVMLSRKPIPPARRKLLAQQLEGLGTIKYHTGQCTLENGATTFVLGSEVAGMAKRLKAALLQQTGLRMNKVRCRGEDGSTDDDEDDELAQAGVAPEPQPAPRAPAPAAESPAKMLDDAPQVWGTTRELLKRSLDALKTAVQTQCAGESEAFAAQVDGQLAQLDRILARLDTRLADTLEQVRDAGDTAARQAALKKARAILGGYMRYVKSEPLIALIDRNPFGVPTSLAEILTRSLTHLARAIG